MGSGDSSAFEEPLHVLFLCTGNSARSVLAEAALSRLGGDRFRSSSAGSEPKSAPHPTTLLTLEAHGYDTRGYRSKSWDEFAMPGAPRIDVVLTVCDNAGREAEEGGCPVWPGAPISAHWGVEDPAAFEGEASEERALFERTYAELLAKVEALVELDPIELGRDGFLARLREIGAAWLS